MTVESKLDQIITAISTITPTTPIDISGLATAAEVAALSAKIDALAAVVGTETAPVAPAPAPAA